MKKIYPYSQDKSFLKKISSLINQEQWVRIILLDFKTETPIMNIEGEIASGTLNKNGSSAVRRTCSLSCTIDAFSYDTDDVKAKYSIGKKIFLEFGITNDTEEYSEEEIIWFPQGTFFISSFSISSSSNGSTTINLQFKDKMATLDGTAGGILPATTRFDLVTDYVNGAVVSKKVLVYDIIMEAVNHFGGEDLTNIIIDDVPTKAKRIIRWIGTEPIWIFKVSDGGESSYDICFDSDIDEKSEIYQGTGTKYIQNQDIGFMYEDFVYDSELTFAAGSKVTDVLDKIKNWLGNYEYFYDENGIFHFQEIKNYLNTGQATYEWETIQNLTDEDYSYESSQCAVVYTFADDTNLTSITNTPVYENIKNDYIVEGKTSNNEAVRYHLVIDDKPEINTEGFSNVLIYKDPITNNYTIGKPIICAPTQTYTTIEDESALQSDNWTASISETENKYLITTKNEIYFSRNGELLVDEGYQVSLDDGKTWYTDTVSVFGERSYSKIQIANTDFSEGDIDTLLSHITMTYKNPWTWSLPDIASDGAIYGLLDEPQLFSFKKKMKNASEFSRYYANVVSEENSLKQQEDAKTLKSAEVDSLVDVLENYLYLTVNTDEKDIPTGTNQCLLYESEIMSIIRKLQREGKTSSIISSVITLEEYIDSNWEESDGISTRADLYKEYREKEADINSDIYSLKSSVLEFFILLISNINANPIVYAANQEDLNKLCIIFNFLKKIYPDYTTDFTCSYENDEDYWPDIAISTRSLFNGCGDDPSVFERITWINDEISQITILKTEVGVLSNVYTNIVSNYTLQQSISSDDTSSTYLYYTNMIDFGNEIISLYNKIKDTANERLSILYAILTFLGYSDSEIGASYIEVDAIAPAFVTSFWYFDGSNETNHSYGWVELEWQSYYHSKEDVAVNENGVDCGCYHSGLGSESYIDFNDINFWDNVDYTAENMKEIEKNYGISFSDEKVKIENVAFKFSDSSLVSTGDAIDRILYQDCEVLTFGTETNGDTWQFSDSFPSMNSNSKWYKNYYQDYAEKNNLYYFKEGESEAYVPKDWRVELILEGLEANENGTDTGAYFSELIANWPNVYDFKNNYLIPSSTTDIDYFVDTTAIMEVDTDGNKYEDENWQFNSDTIEIDEDVIIINAVKNNYDSTNYCYFFDMIDSSSSRWGEYSVNNIGRRTNVTISDSVNCIFSPNTPDYAFINVTGMTTDEREQSLSELQGITENIIQVTDSFYNNFATGGLKQSAYDQIKYDLQIYTTYQNTVSVTARPCFYLEPNVRACLQDESTGTVGDYVIKTISIPLGAGNNMSVSLSKVLERA